MKKKSLIRKYIISFAVLGALPLFYVNCGGSFQAEEMKDLSSIGDSLFNSKSKGNPFMCTSPDRMGKTPLTRLTRNQYSNTVLNAFGTELASKLALPIGTLYEDVLTKSVDEFRAQIDATQMQAYQSIAESAYNAIQASPAIATQLAGTCINTSPVTAECKQNFVKNLGKKMFRRPLTPAEVTKYTTSVFDKGQSAIDSVGLTVYAYMIAPPFLLRLELGNDADTAAVATYNLSSYQVAARLSYLLWDAPPDATLMAAADANQLSSQAELSPQVDRMLKDPRAKAKIREFFRFWLDPKKYSPSSFTADFLNGFDVNAGNAEFEREMFEFIDYVIFQKNGTFNDLLTGKESFARNGTAAQTYGHAVVTGSAPAMMDGNRKGLLMRAPVIATEGNETHPIIRGVQFKRRFLCDVLGLPSGIMTNDPTFFSDMARMKSSTRERTHGLTSSPTCFACHSSINAFGFAFENFDGLGRVRAKERSYSTMGAFLAEFPVDTRVGGLTIEHDTNYSVNDGNEVIDKMLAGNKVPACFVQQVYRFYQLKSESAADGCQLQSMYNRIKAEDYEGKPLLSVFKELFVYPSVLKRTLQ